MNERFKAGDARFEKIDERFDAAEDVQQEILNAVGTRLDESDARHERRDQQIKQLATHTGLKLAA